MAIAHHDSLRRVLDLDVDLGVLLPEGRAHAAREELLADVLELQPGAWEPDWRPTAGHLGLLVIDGVLSREVVSGGNVAPELLGPGDVARPWDVDAAAPTLLEVRWSVLAEARIAVLDARFTVRAARYPEIAVALADRLEARAQRLATLQAIGRLGRVDERLIALFWHLADRWGRVTHEGVVVPLTLSHRMLGQLIGARRPTVTSALARLTDSGRLRRRDDASWLLLGVPEPTGEAAAFVKPRRHLLTAPEVDPTRLAPGYEFVVAAAKARSDSAAGREAVREMSQRLASLRAETDARAQALRDACEASAAICRTTERIRRRRRLGTAA